MHAKRLLVLLLSAVLAACMLAGCDWLWWLENGDGSSSSSSGSGSSSSSSRPSHDGGSDSRPDPSPDPDPEPDPDPVLQSISVQNNRSYQVGDAFDQTSLTVTAHYDDQSQHTIEISSCEVSLPDGFGGTFTAAGDYTITVSYTEGEATQTASVTIPVTVDPNDTSTWEVRGQTLMVPRGAKSSQVNKALLEQHSVTAIDLSESDLTAIEEEAFYICDLITSIDLGNVTSIGTRAFASCDELTHVDLGRVTVIPEDAFFDCGSLSDIDLKYVTSIGPSAFSSCGLTEADLTSVTSLGGSAFCGCFDLTSVKLGSNLTSIEESAFLACEKLTEIDLSHITSIGNDAFVGCTNLTDVDLSSATSIGTNAFVGCTNLTDVRLGSRKDRALPTVVGTTPFITTQAVTVYADFSTEEEAAYQQTIAGWFDCRTIQFKPDSAWQNRASKTASLLRGALPF